MRAGRKIYSEHSGYNGYIGQIRGFRGFNPFKIGTYFECGVIDYKKRCHTGEILIVYRI